MELNTSIEISAILKILKVRPFQSAPASSLKVRVEVYEPLRLEWTSHGLGLSAKRIISVEPSANDGSIFRHSEHASGITSRIMPAIFVRVLTRTIEGFNAGLRDSIVAAKE